MTSVFKQTVELAKSQLLRMVPEVDEYALARARHRGEQADQLLKHELLTEAFDTVERVYMDAWRMSDAADVERRERAWMAVCLLADLKNVLITTVREGDAAARKVHYLASR